MPAISRFVDGTGPVFSGQLFPFLFITIACGAVSGFHSLVSSGTTPKMIENENQIRMIGYGAHADGKLRRHHGVDRRLRDRAGRLLRHEQPGRRGRHHGRPGRADHLGLGLRHHARHARPRWPQDIGETTILSRAGGAPTLAVGMAHILSNVIGGKALMAFWYHFAILFEALFILTTMDAGTRVARFMIQDLLGHFVPALKQTESWGANVVATASRSRAGAGSSTRA